LALGIGPGDEVILPTFTMSASAFAVCYTGAMPIFVDADPKTWNIDTDKIEEKITKKTKAIMTVSIFGQPCNLDKIIEIKSKFGLAIIEDSAEAHGAEYKGRKISEYVDVMAYSFYANKHITTGEGGMVTTNNEEIYDKCRYYRNMCFSLDGNRNYLHHDIGFNYRMPNVIAAIGLAQIEKAEEYIQMRIQNGEYYRELLKGLPCVIMQQPDKDSKGVYWMNGILLDNKEIHFTRDMLRNHLSDNGIETRLFFQGMHRQPSLKKYGCNMSGVFPISDLLSDYGFYLPSASTLKRVEIEYICERIRDFCQGKVF
jgi:perosamine synthetase